MPCCRTLSHLGGLCSRVTCRKASTAFCIMVIASTSIGGGGACWVEGVDEVSNRPWSAINMEARMQAQCMTWLFAYFDVSWGVHGGPRSQVPCSARDAMEVRRGHGHM